MGTSAAAQKQQRTGKARAASRGIRHRVLPRRKEVLLHWPTRLRHSCFFSVLLFSVFLFSCLLGLMPEAPTGWRGMSAGKPEMPRSLRSIGPGQSRLAPKNFPFAGETACRGWLLPGSRFAACTAPLFEASSSLKRPADVFFNLGHACRRKDSAQSTDCRRGAANLAQ
jgi:hypothetical protein